MLCKNITGRKKQWVSRKRTPGKQKAKTLDPENETPKTPPNTNSSCSIRCFHGTRTYPICDIVISLPKGLRLTFSSARNVCPDTCSSCKLYQQSYCKSLSTTYMVLIIIIIVIIIIIIIIIIITIITIIITIFIKSLWHLKVKYNVLHWIIIKILQLFQINSGGLGRFTMFECKKAKILLRYMNEYS